MKTIRFVVLGADPREDALASIEALAVDGSCLAIWPTFSVDAESLLWRAARWNPANDQDLLNESVPVVVLDACTFASGPEMALVFNLQAFSELVALLDVDLVLIPSGEADVPTVELFSYLNGLLAPSVAD